MRIHFFKSPVFLTGCGAAGSGAVGIGGWQIVEETYPTVDKRLSKQNYRYEPVQVPNETKSEGQKFVWDTWDCFAKLFPGLKVNNGESSTTTSIKEYKKDQSVSLKTANNPVGCAIMELRPETVGNDAQYANRIYFKSEFVIRGEDSGWAMWTGISTLPTKAQTSTGFEASADFYYQLIFIKKKQDGGWEIDRGYKWSNDLHTQASENIFYIKVLDEWWFKKRTYKDTTPFEKRRWVGFGELDETSDKEILQSISLSASEDGSAEIMGSNGVFTRECSDTDVNSPGYCTVSRYYDVSDTNPGWKTTSDNINLSSELTMWYEPFKGKKVRWTELERRCNNWSRSRGADEVNAKLLKDLCYKSGSG